MVPYPVRIYEDMKEELMKPYAVVENYTTPPREGNTCVIMLLAMFIKNY